MLNKNELLFVVNANNLPIEPKPRHEVHQNHYWHRTSHIWIYNSQKEILCQKRSLLKDSSPSLWEAFFGGHAGAGKEMTQAAAEEVNEELQISVKPENLQKVTVFRNQKATEFEYIFALKTDLDAETIEFEKEEIDQIKWVAIDQLKQILLEKSQSGWNILGYEKTILDFLEKI